MNDCSKCKFSEEDYIFDEEIGDEYPIYTCSKGNDTSLDYECKDFEEYKPKKYKEKDTKCDKCEHLEICLDKGNVIDCRTVCDTRSHYIAGRMGCVELSGKVMGIDVSVDAVNEYAKSILGRYPKDNMEFSRALAMKILEETKSLANSTKKE